MISTYWRYIFGIYGTLAVALSVAFGISAEWNDKLVHFPVHGQLLAGTPSVLDQSEGGVAPPSVGIYQRIRRTAVAREAEYGFVNFNRDHLRIAYRINATDFKRYNSDYGYRPEDIEALRRWRTQSLQTLQAKNKGKKSLDAEAAKIEKDYTRRLRDYLENRGFRLEEANTTRIDMPVVVRRNGPLLKSLANSFDRIAVERNYRSIDIIGAVLSWSQTAVAYREPDDVFKGKHTGGILPPITTVVLGWGDCDTKTALVSSILSNWPQMRMIGISVPGHYLMAVLQIPDKGDMFIEYQGLEYILLEPVGPAWLPPGQVAEETLAQLNDSNGYKIDPFF